MPVLISLKIREDVVELVALKRSGSVGLGGTYSEALQGWLIKFWDHRFFLICVESFVDWLENQNPPWISYQEFMYGCLIALDKIPGVRPAGVGEMWRRFFAKFVLKVTGSKATHM